MGGTKRSGDRYQFDGVELGGIRNRNERRVIEMMGPVLEQYPEVARDVLNIQDIYALALNLLPARYTQDFSIVLNDPVKDRHVRDALQKAVEQVRANPTGPNRKFESD